ncbi:MAG: hypothetical protein Q4G14_12385 [Paracoccus sp. (in: a-proteobacteria)]|nr:hypothetical protein [Paracoccus sp. (in: a-proteobacteria)]MDO5614022.1 hypothetical protein [Paracoccus sp. (in: a-proteobacteria)]
MARIASSKVQGHETSKSLTAGDNRVDPGRAVQLAGQPLGKADAA